MVLFGVKFKRNKISIDYVNLITSRFIKGKDIIRTFANSEGFFILIERNYFKAWWPLIPLAFVLLGYYFRVLPLIVIAAVAFALLFFMGSSYSNFWVLKVALEKKGFKEKIVYLNHKEALREVIRWRKHSFMNG